jgi:tRNA pseudouridine13 synthase
MTFDPLAPLPLLTPSLPGIGGRIKQQPEDFEVEEIPAYEPCGSGDFLYLWIEKRGMGAEFFVRQVARRLGIAPGEVGSAGLKDRQAVTRQMVSVPDVGMERLAALEGDDLHVLRISRHTNKLRPGHLHGNRFRVLVREPDPAAGERLASILEQMRTQGLPNYYGAQRFGREGETVFAGMALLRGEKPAASARPQNWRSPFLRKLALSAAQSALFNHYLASRLTDGLLRQVLAGDVMSKWPTGGLFVATDLLREQVRFDARETIHTGPIFGRKTFAAQEDAAARETATLAAAQLDGAAFRGFGKLLQGTRRYNLVYVDDLAAAVEPAGIRFTFTLPAGSYATVLLQEFMKSSTLESQEAVAEGRTQRS